MKLNPKLSIVTSMVIFGTIGVLRRYIPYTSGFVAFARGIIGVAFIALFFITSGRKLSIASLKKDFLYLFASGVCIGFNWILLFEAYNYTTVAVATLCYYMEPIFVIAASPFLLKEKLNFKKTVCVIFALMGMVMVSGVLNSDFSGISELRGVIFGIGAAILYASVIIINKKIKNVDIYEKTACQLLVASLVLIPYLIINKEFSNLTFTFNAMIPLLILGIVHTGLAYVLYFGSIERLKAQTVAVLSYIDPVVAVLLSVVFLHEKMTLLSIIGAVLILGSAYISDTKIKNT